MMKALTLNLLIHTNPNQTDKMEKEVEHAERMQGEAPEVLNTAPQKAPEKLELPPNSIKVRSSSRARPTHGWTGTPPSLSHARMHG